MKQEPVKQEQGGEICNRICEYKILRDRIHFVLYPTICCTYFSLYCGDHFFKKNERKCSWSQNKNAGDHVVMYLLLIYLLVYNSGVQTAASRPYAASEHHYHFCNNENVHDLNQTVGQDYWWKIEKKLIVMPNRHTVFCWKCCTFMYIFRSLVRHCVSQIFLQMFTQFTWLKFSKSLHTFWTWDHSNGFSTCDSFYLIIFQHFYRKEKLKQTNSHSVVEGDLRKFPAKYLYK